MPVNMNNTTDVVAVQMTIVMPEGFSIHTSTASLSERADDHTLEISQLSDNRYLVLLMSGNNKPFKGGTGKLFDVDVYANTDLQEGSEHSIIIENAVMSNLKGDNVLSSVDLGNILIQNDPDLEVSSVTTQSKNVAHNDTLAIAWVVKNVGADDTRGGWREEISLVSADGSMCVLGSTYCDDVLIAGGAMSRSVILRLPDVLSVGGEAVVQIRLVPYSNCGERQEAQANNIAVSEKKLNVKQHMYLNLSANSVTEGEGSEVAATVTRSGNWNESVTFDVKISADKRVKAPLSVTIPTGHSAASFSIIVLDNTDIDSPSTKIEVTVSGKDGYDDAVATFALVDNERASLTLTTSKETVTEGESFTLKAEVNRVPSEDCIVQLLCDEVSMFSYPSTFVIPAGKSSVEIAVMANDDELPDLTTFATFTAACDAYMADSVAVVVEDNDLPVIELHLTPNVLNENAGPKSIVARLVRKTNIDKKVTIRLSDNSDRGDIYYETQSVVLEKGAKEETFTMGVNDNLLVDGDREATITAAVFVSSCNCSAAGESAGIVSQTIKIVDNDGPSLSLAASRSVILEGAAEGTVLTVTRNSDNRNPLTVNLSSDNDAALSYSHEVTIPAGANSAEVMVKANANDVNGDSHNVVFLAESDGFSSGVCWAMVSDQTLPDVVITGLEVDPIHDVFSAQGKASVKVKVENVGAAQLPAQSRVMLYMSNSSDVLLTLYTSKAIEPGESTMIERVVTLPKVVGDFDMYAVANENKQVKELLYTNNTSDRISVKIAAPFSVSVNTDKRKYANGEAVHIAGHATSNGSNASEGTEIEVYVTDGSLRQTFTATTGANGQFSVEFNPFEGQVGHFIVGACYPGEGATAEQDAFDVCGLKRTDSRYITNDILLGNAFDGTVELLNPCGVSLSGVKAEVRNASDDCYVSVEIPSSIGAGAKAMLKYTLKGKKITEVNDWMKVNVAITSAEGMEYIIPLYYYVRDFKPHLTASVEHIKSSMPKGGSHDYVFNLINTGKGETGTVTLDLPKWMKCISVKNIPSLAQNDTAQVILRFEHNLLMPMNVSLEGEIGVNCESGEGLCIPYTVEPVSDASGRLTIDVCDEFTYYTSEAPHVKGATVIVKHPVTELTIAEGTTGTDGIYSVELPEGYYKVLVAEPKHDYFEKTLIVDPGKDNRVTVDLGYQAISVKWSVVETEVEDVYELVTTTKFETEVPMPVVTLTGPESVPIDSMAVGESRLLYYTMTNHGLIRANNVMLHLPKPTEEFTMQALAHTDAFELEAKQSVVIPVVFTRISDGTKEVKSRQNKVAGATTVWGTTFMNCMASMDYEYGAICGSSLKGNKGALNLALRACIAGSIWAVFSGGNSSGPSFDKPVPGGEYHNNSSSGDYAGTPSFTICDPDDAGCGVGLIDGGLGMLGGPAATVAGGLGNLAGELSNAKLRLTGEDVINGRRRYIYGRPAAIPIGNAVVAGREARKAGKQIKDLYDACKNTVKKLSSGVNKRYVGSAMDKQQTNIWKQAQLDRLKLIEEQCYDADSICLEIFGDDVWYLEQDDEKVQFLARILDMDPTALSYSELLTYKPSAVSDEQLALLIDRWRKTGEEVEGGNGVSQERLHKLCERILERERITQDKYSCADMGELLEQTIHEYVNFYSEASANVCSSVTLQFKQTMSMTRQAFRGTLEVVNAHEFTQMKNVKLTIQVRNIKTGALTTSHEMQINAEKLEGFEGVCELGKGWTLAPNTTGVATILFIPTKYAAPKEEQQYSFAGTLTYYDPYTEYEVTRDLAPVVMTIKPSPELDLVYFMQRDIIGDDPLTEEIEAKQDAEFALLIKNKGYGDATNVRMVTEQPEIIENEKGLDIDFEIMSAQVNGQEKSLAFGQSIATDFGTIPSKTNIYAQWWLQSSLLGHFTEYNIEATHMTSYGNPDLTLLDSVTIHELIHSIDVDAVSLSSKKNEGNSLKGWLVNDVADRDDQPETLYLSDGSVIGVNPVNSALVTDIGNKQYRITLLGVEMDGWYYGSVADPTYGLLKLAKVERSNDWAVIEKRNFWTTDRTLRDGKDPLYEHRIHFADRLSRGSASYVLTFIEHDEDDIVSVEAVKGSSDDSDFSVNKENNSTHIIYDLQGRRLDSSSVFRSRGIYIINGKKVVR